jgi:hypothetical protein
VGSAFAREVKTIDMPGKQASDKELTIPLRITLHRVPADVRFALQYGKSGVNGHPSLVPPTRTTSDSLSFDFDVRVDASKRGTPRFLGEFTQGPADKRFVYVNSGQSAGQSGTFWNRRAKIPLTTITTDLIEKVQTGREMILEIEIEGTLKDGGPVCASHLSSREWHPVRR